MAILLANGEHNDETCMSLLRHHSKGNVFNFHSNNVASTLKFCPYRRPIHRPDKYKWANEVKI